MKLKKLFERRNPHLNKKENVIDVLKTYSGDKTIFVSFHRLPKIGVNPKSYKYLHNPLGVYAYPLDYIINSSKTQHIHDIGFATDSTYLSIIKVNGNILDLNDNSSVPILSAITKSILFQGVKDWGNNSFVKQFKMYLERSISELYNKDLDEGDAEYEWFKLCKASDFIGDSRAMLSKRFRQKGIDCIADYGGYTLTFDIEAQAVVINPKSLKVLKMMENK